MLPVGTEKQPPNLKADHLLYIHGFSQALMERKRCLRVERITKDQPEAKIA